MRRFLPPAVQDATQRRHRDFLLGENVTSLQLTSRGDAPEHARLCGGVPDSRSRRGRAGSHAVEQPTRSDGPRARPTPLSPGRPEDSEPVC